MRSNRGLSEFASFPLLIVIALVVIIVSLLMLVTEFQNQTDDADFGTQASGIALIHAARDGAETYLVTALDRSVRQGIAEAYAFDSLACPRSPQGLPIYTDGCGYERSVFMSRVAEIASYELARSAQEYPSAVLDGVSVSVSDKAIAEISDAVIFHETGTDSIYRWADVQEVAAELPLFIGGLEVQDELPETLGSMPDLSRIGDSSLAYCADDPMSELKASRFVQETIDYCASYTGTCSCGSVPLPTGTRVDGSVYGFSLADAIFEVSDPVDRVFVYRDGSNVMVAGEDPGLSTCSKQIENAVATSTSEFYPLIYDVSTTDILLSDAPLDQFDPGDAEVIIAIGPALPGDPAGSVSYYGSQNLVSAHDLALRSNERVYQSPEWYDSPREEFGEDLTSCGDDPYLISTTKSSVRIDEGDVGLQGFLLVSGIDPETQDVLYIRYPLETPVECGREPIEPGTDAYRSMIQGIMRAADQALKASANPPPTQIVCVNDPIKEWYEDPETGLQKYADVYPTVSVPLERDWVWPLERIDDFESCWGPKVSGGVITGYHKGLDIQPPGTRVDYRTSLDRFTDYAVVSAFSGTIKRAHLCPFTVYDTQAGLVEGLTRDQLIDKVDGSCRSTTGAESFGEHLVIESEDKKFRAIYAHLAPGSVKEVFGLPESAPLSAIEGTPVVAGQRLGFVGNTGSSTGAHLHFEVYDEWNGGGYPESSAGPGAQGMSQFNPLCALPNEVLKSGVAVDISTMFGSGASTESDSVEGSDSFDDSTMYVPSSEVENCNFNYWMAYNNYNPLPSTYGVCPANIGIPDQGQEPAGPPQTYELVPVSTGDDTTEIMLIVDGATITPFALEADATIRIADADVDTAVSAAVSIEDPQISTGKKYANILVALPEEAVSGETYNVTIYPDFEIRSPEPEYSSIKITIP